METARAVPADPMAVMVAATRGVAATVTIPGPAGTVPAAGVQRAGADRGATTTAVVASLAVTARGTGGMTVMGAVIPVDPGTTVAVGRTGGRIAGVKTDGHPIGVTIAVGATGTSVRTEAIATMTAVMIAAATAASGRMHPHAAKVVSAGSLARAAGTVDVLIHAAGGKVDVGMNGAPNDLVAGSRAMANGAAGMTATRGTATVPTAVSAPIIAMIAAVTATAGMATAVTAVTTGVLHDATTGAVHAAMTAATIAVMLGARRAATASAVTSVVLTGATIAVMTGSTIVGVASVVVVRTSARVDSTATAGTAVGMDGGRTAGTIVGRIVGAVGVMTARADSTVTVGMASGMIAAPRTASGTTPTASPGSRHPSWTRMSPVTSWTG